MGILPGSPAELNWAGSILPWFGSITFAVSSGLEAIVTMRFSLIALDMTLFTGDASCSHFLCARPGVLCFATLRRILPAEYAPGHRCISVSHLDSGPHQHSRFRRANRQFGHRLFHCVCLSTHKRGRSWSSSHFDGDGCQSSAKC